MDNYNEIEAAKQLLKENGYFTDNLWSVEDVQSKFKCTDEQAQEVLNDAFGNEATYEQIWFSIKYYGQELGLEENDENQFR